MKPIAGFPNYSVTEDGRVFYAPPPRELKQNVNKGGYPCVGIENEGLRQTFPVHKLVLDTYVGPRKEGELCRHRDGDRKNNRLGNLSWGTSKENAADRTLHGKTVRGEGQHKSVLTAADVEWIRAYPSRYGMFKEMASRLQVSPGTIRNAYLGKTWGHVVHTSYPTP